MKPSADRPLHSVARFDAAPLIDSALSRLGKVQPDPGFESRLAARLAAANTTASPQVRRFPFPAGLGAAAMAAALAAAAVLLVANDHTPRRIAPPPAARFSRQGFGAASAAHVPTQEVQTAVRGRSVVRPAKGRAILAPHPSRKNPGTTVPRSPFPANAPSADQPAPQP